MFTERNPLQKVIFLSGNPTQHKEAVVKTLQIRANFLSLCPALRTDEWDHVLNDLKVNSYPGSVLKKYLDNKTKPRRGVHPLAILRLANLEPMRTLGQIFRKRKDRPTINQVQGIVDKVCCHDCTR